MENYINSSSLLERNCCNHLFWNTYGTNYFCWFRFTLKYPNSGLMFDLRFIKFHNTLTLIITYFLFNLQLLNCSINWWELPLVFLLKIKNWMDGKFYVLLFMYNFLYWNLWDKCLKMLCVLLLFWITIVLSGFFIAKYIDWFRKISLLRLLLLKFAQKLYFFNYNPKI